MNDVLDESHLSPTRIVLCDGALSDRPCVEVLRAKWFQIKQHSILVEILASLPNTNRLSQKRNSR